MLQRYIFKSLLINEYHRYSEIAINSNFIYLKQTLSVYVPLKNTNHIFICNYQSLRIYDGRPNVKHNRAYTYKCVYIYKSCVLSS